MSLTTILIIAIPAVILFIFLNLVSRELFQRLQEKKRQAEREQALSESLSLDFTRESRTLKRVEVEEPLARILCVDDEEIVLDSLRKILVLDGYSVDTVETGQEALGLIQSHDYDFVFTDLKMPSMSGTEVAKSVKHMRPDIDVVIITGFATVESAVECMKHGAIDYIEKPFTEDELRRFVKYTLIRRQDRQQKQLQPRVHVTGPASAGPSGEFSVPGGALISAGHCWASLAEDGTAKIGLDDFAGKLLGHINHVELPEVGQQVKAGERLFSVGQNHRRAHFHAPLSGKVVKINTALRDEPENRENLSYGRNWVCVIEGDNLDAELPGLKIGNSAVAFFQQDIDRFRAFVQQARGDEVSDPSSLFIGAFESLNDDQWESAAREFFGR
jgi:CheY-like chemotaxis protein